MRLGFVADVHIGNHKRFGGAVESGINARCRAVLDALSRAVTRAARAECGALVVLGDLFDTARPEPQIIAAVQNILSVDMPVILLMGNHEQVSTQTGDHALGPLEHCTEVIEAPKVIRMSDTELWLVPFQPGPSEGWLPRALDDLAGQCRKWTGSRVLCLHLGIRDDKTAPWLKAAHDSVAASNLTELCAQHKVEAVFAGNWHDHRQWNLADADKVVICQVGTLAPTGFDNPGFAEHGFLVRYDTAIRGLTRECIAGPRFLKTRTRPSLADFEAWQEEGLQVYLQLVSNPDSWDAERAEVEALLKSGALVAGEVVADDAEAKAEARTAAQAARSADTLAQALAGFVEAMPLPDGVDRSQVLERARRYLAV